MAMIDAMTAAAKSIDVFVLLSPEGREMALSVTADGVLRDVLRTAAGKFNLLDASGGLGSLQLRRQCDPQPLDLERQAKDILRPGDRLFVEPEPHPFHVDAYVLPSGKGELHLHSAWEPKVIVNLPARLMKVIILLQEARESDERQDIPLSLSGFRMAAFLAARHDGHPDVVLESTTLIRYLANLCRLLKAAAPKAPPLIDRVRGFGARLRFPVNIHFLGA